jgi:hypothetical protein|tara:strand:- start:289 stop:678 length:390 start_codon:yes stop_codon:yes gene_type:complete
MVIIAALAIVILAISLRALMSMETSLEEGRGPQGGILLATLPMMVLMTVLVLLMLTQIRRGPIELTTDHLRIAALMAAMFVIGMLIEPAIPRPEGSPGDAFGAIFILIPILLIAAMLISMIPNRSDEEE